MEYPVHNFFEQHQEAIALSAKNKLTKGIRWTVAYPTIKLIKIIKNRIKKSGTVLDDCAGRNEFFKFG